MMPEGKGFSILIFFNHQLSKQVLSGGEKMFLEVSRRFNKFSIDCYAVVPEISVDSLRKENLNFRFFVVPGFKFEQNSYFENLKDLFLMGFVLIYRTVYGSFKVFKWLKESRADVIYSTGDFIADTVPVVIAKLFRKKFKWIVLVHHIIDNPFKRKGMNMLSNIGSFLMQRFSFILIKFFANGVFIKNCDVKQDLSKIGFDARKLFVIDNGVDLKRIKSMPSDYPEPFDACYIGRLSATKGISDLINVWSRVVRVSPGARLAIIGGGSAQLEEAKRYIVRDLGLEKNIRILGSLADEDAYRIRKTSKVSLSCSYEEGWGITIAESLACGVPCVVYDLPVYFEKFNGAVEMVPRGDIDNFSKSVINLMNNGNKRNKMASCGKEIVQKYDIEGIVKQEVEIIRELL